MDMETAQTFTTTNPSSLLLLTLFPCFACSSSCAFAASRHHWPPATLAGPVQTSPHDLRSHWLRAPRLQLEPVQNHPTSLGSYQTHSFASDPLCRSNVGTSRSGTPRRLVDIRCGTSWASGSRTRRCRR